MLNPRGFMGGAKCIDGICMVSNMKNTTRIFPATIAQEGQVMDFHGNCEHLRPFLKRGRILDAGELVWLTDRTPHESLPAPRKGVRQFVRVVSSKVSAWFEDHNTANPLMKPRCRIIKGNKFKDDTLKVMDR